jgi:DNA-binding transcriptional LysR family regulator
MRSLALMAEGELLYARSTRILDDGCEAENAISKARAVPKGRPKISVPTVLGWRVIVPALPCFVGAHREVELDLWLDDRKVDIVDEDFDAVLRLGELADSGLIARKVAPHHFTTCAAQSYLAAHGTPKAPAELVAHRCLRYRFPSTGRVEQWAFKGTSAPQALGGGLVLNDDEALACGALAGLGWFRFRPTSFQRTWRPDACNVCSCSVPPTVATYSWSGQRRAPTSHVSVYSLTSFRSCLQRRHRRTGNMELRACSVMRQTVSLDGGLICAAEGVTIGNPNSHLGCRQAAEEPSRCCHAPWLMVNLP